MARFVIGEHDLVLRLTALEWLAATRRSPSVPLSAVRDVDVVEKPWDHFLVAEVRMGFAAGGAPGRTIVTAGPRARTNDGGEAVVFVYMNRTAIAVRTDPAFQGPRLLVASSPAADENASDLRAAAHL
jgi:hypothetical protein